MFTPSRLTLARERRGLTQAALAERAGLSTRIITTYENGAAPPSEETLLGLARLLRFPIEFFKKAQPDRIDLDTVSFRSMKSMKASQRDGVLGAGALALELTTWIDEKFRLPPPNLPFLRQQDVEPEAAAESLRAHWGLGERPIRNMVHLLESQGVRVFSLAEDCVEVDAFSFWKGETPFVFLNTLKSAEHGRFDAAHELGHLVLHKHGGPRGREAEHQADRFASAFLMPRGSVLAAAPRFPTVETLIKLKKTWSVSVAALAHRLHSLGLLSEWHYRGLCIEVTKRGYRKAEPEGVPRETSQVLNKVFAALRDDGISKADVAHDLCIQPSELDALVFGLILVPVSGSGGDNKGGGRRGPNLRLV